MPTVEHAVHPIHNFPNELLAQVFRAGATTTLQEWTTRPENTVPPLPLPMVICAVSQHWRQVALNSPDLWSAIHVPLFFSRLVPRSLLYDPVRFTSIWLTRSKDAPLSIFLRVTNVRLAYDLVVSILLPSILQHTHRIRRFFILGNANQVLFLDIKGILSLVSSRFGIDDPIHTLTLKFEGNDNARATDIQAVLDRDWGHLPGKAPAFPVRHLSAEGIRFSPSFFPLLVSLDIAHLQVTFNEFQTLFPSLPHLQNLCLSYLHVLAPSPAATEPITVPSLRFLSLSFYRWPHTSTTSYPIKHLRLPNLSSLALDGEGGVPICSCFGFPFVSSLNRLESLTLRNFVRFALDPDSEVTRSDVQLLHSLSTIKNVILISTSPGNLLNLTSSASSPTSLTSHPPARQKSLIRTTRPTLSPEMSEVSRTLEGMFQQLRVNGASPSRPPASPTTRPSASSPQSASGPAWPVLSSISVDTIYAVGLVGVCNHLSSNSSVKVVRLSGPARRHLSHTIKRRLSDGTFYATNFFTRKDDWAALKDRDEDHASGVESAAEWMQRRVQILPFEDVSNNFDMD